jgi:hypothetical protein
MTQVDLGWPVSAGLTRLIRSLVLMTLIKNLGRHTAWWHEQQDEVMDGFLVEPQNQGRAGTTWEPSHEWQLAEATPSAGFPVVHQKTTRFVG